MAQAMASMAGLGGSSQVALEGSLHITRSSSLTGAGTNRMAIVSRPGLSTVRAEHLSTENEAVTQSSSRRAVLGLVASGLAGESYVKAVLAAATSIKVGPPPPPFGGLPGTLNADEPRDLELPLKERFYLQALPPQEAAQRAKESAKDILNVKEFIDKKAWPYVQNDLRLKASYLRFDLNTVISAKPKEEKKSLKELTGKLFAKIDNLDHAAKVKSPQQADKYYAETKSAIDNVLAKLA